MSKAAAALFLREWRIARRIGGGAAPFTPPFLALCALTLLAMAGAPFAAASALRLARE